VDLNALRTALEAFVQDQTLVIPSTQISTWPSVQALVAANCAAETLTITGTATVPAQDAIVYTGTATLFPWTTTGMDPVPVQAELDVTARFTIDAALQPQLLVRAQVPNDGSWHLSDSLEALWDTALAGVAFEAGGFYLTSAPGSDSTYPGPLATGLQFTGTVATSEAFAPAAWILAQPDSRTVAGPVALPAGSQPIMSLSPVATRPVALGGVQLDAGPELRSWIQSFEADPDPPTDWPIATAELVAHLQLETHAQPLVLRMPMVEDAAGLAMSVAEADVPLGGWSELAPLTGGAELAELIPPQTPPASALRLRGLDLFLDLGDGTTAPERAAVAMDVEFVTNDWAVLPAGIMTLSGLGVRLSVDFTSGGGPSVGGVLYGRFTLLEEADLYAEMSVADIGGAGPPEVDLTVGLDDGSSIDVAAVMAHFMQRLTGLTYTPPLPMSILQLDIGVSVTHGTFQLDSEIVTGWSVDLGGGLATLSFDGIGLQIAYDGVKVSGAITATTTIAPPAPPPGAGTPSAGVQLYASASTAGGPNAGWDLAAGMMPGRTISILALLTNFMFPSGDVPGGSYGIPSLEVTAIDLALSLDKGGKPYSFSIGAAVDGSWSFKPLGAGSPELTLAVVLSVEGKRAVVAGNVVDADAAWSISGDVQGTLVLFGLTITAGYAFAQNNSTLTFGVWYGRRGIEATVTQRPSKPSVPQSPLETVLTVRLGDLSLGEILEFLVHLAVPGESRRLPAPWDVLYQIDFKNLGLVANLTTHDVEVTYDLRLDLKFAKFDKIALLYRKVNGEGRVYVRLYGEFLGQPYGDDKGSEPLSWDVVGEEAPAVSGKGPEFLKLHYVGLGQHVALSISDDQLTTVESVIGPLKASMKPVAGGGNPLTDPAAATLRYDGAGKWLFGVQATLVETVALSAVFYDPHLYGALIELSGERAGSLAGLRFELVYRRVTADIGEFSVDLTIPEKFRNWEFGEVSVTLGLIHLDVYTNGNFRIDAGFPHNGDFSSSFAVEVFPFLGRGGFYFAYLTGATSSRVPKADNGVFDPVIEAGVGISVGVGKDFSKGPLRAGLTLELYAILEGVFAPFAPYGRALPRESYYWFQGTAGIVGKLYGTVDFVVLKLSVSVVASARATLTIEAHEPTQIDLSLEVEAEGSVEVLFVTLHFNFSLTIDASFTIGSHTPPPWTHAVQAQPAAEPLLRADVLGPPALMHAQPQLRAQRGGHRPRPLRRLRHARDRLPALRAEPGLRAGRARAALLAGPSGGPDSVTGWAPVAVYGTGVQQTAVLLLVPGFTIADPTTLHPPGPAGANQVQVVLTLLAENTVAPSARSADEVAQVATDHLHYTDDDGLACVPRLIDAFLRWAAAAGAGVAGDQQISAVQLQDLLDDLADPGFREATFAYSNVSGFLAASLDLQVVGYPPTGTPTQTSGTFVPMVPEISTATTIGQAPATSWSFATEPPVSATYTANLDTYFQQLATDATANAAADPFNRPANGGGAPLEAAEPQEDEPATSLAQALFGDYFATLTRAAIQGAIDLLGAYPFQYTSAGPSLNDLAGQFDGIAVPTVLGKGQTLDRLAAATGMHPDDLAAANTDSPAEGATVNVPVGVTALSVAEDNADAALASGWQFNVEGLHHQVSAGQTLDAVAAAAPSQVASGQNGTGIDPPPTGTAVGVQNASVAGLLRAGATLTIPAFTYTCLANDSDAFLTAFFLVRNSGPDSSAALGDGVVARVDWYGQAIATLNPTVDWSKIAPGQTVSVPSAYQNSTAAAAPYPIHQGDTLPRVAATFAKFEYDGSQYTAAAGGGTYAVAQQAHTVASTDTFASLANDFPGLQVADLVGANTAADALTPLATLVLPGYGAQVGEGQTLTSLAASLDLDMAGLVGLVDDCTGIFAPGPLTIRDVPVRSLDVLIGDLLASPQANAVAVQLSRFLMHGMRMPAPDEQAFLALTPEQVLAGEFEGELYGLYDLSGQQIHWADTSQAIDVTLTKSDASWLSFFEGEVSSTGSVVAGDAADSLSLAIDSTSFAPDLPSVTLTLGVSPPAPMPLFDTAPVHHDLQASIHWQAAARPTLPAGGGNQAAQPTIWPFTSELRRVARGAGAGTTPAYGLSSVPLQAPAGMEGTPLGSYAWAVRVPFAIQRVAAAPLPGVDGDRPAPGPRWLERVYVVGGADHEGSELLYGLWTHLQGNASAEAATQLFLAYPPNATGPNSSGLASDALDPDATYLLKTNLSTETREPALARLAGSSEADVAAVYSASIAPSSGPPTDFVAFLWEASIVRPGGFYLHYGPSGSTSGLPDSIFDDTGHATIELLCVLGSQASGSSSGGGLVSFNNAAVVGDSLEAGAVHVYAEQTAAGAPTVKIPSLPAGDLGFTMLRTPPADTDLAGQLYNLVGFQLAAAAPFDGSNEALPAGPTNAPAPDTGKWLYHQVFDAARRASATARIQQANAALPDPSGDPYAGIAAGASASLSFAAHDAFGNRVAATDAPASLSLPFRYADRVIGLSEWPGATVDYAVAPAGGGLTTPHLVIRLALQAASYAPGAGVGSAQALRAASAAAMRYRQVFYQLNRPGIAITATTTLDAASSTTPLVLSLARFTSFASAAYVFCDQLARLDPVQYETGTSDTLGGVATDYSVTAAGLLEANQELLATEVLSGSISVPRFARVERGARLNDIAAAAGLTVPALLGLGHNGDAVVPAGTSLRLAAGVVHQPAAGQTLAQMAAAAGCTPGDVGTANATTAGLIADSLTIAVRRVQVVTSSSTFGSLVSDFAAAGITTSAGEIATLNADLPGIFDVTGGAVTYVVRDWTVPAGPPTTIEAVVAAKFDDDYDSFATSNGDTPGVVAEGTRLRTGTATQAVLSAVTLRDYVVRVVGITMAELAEANPAAALTAATTLTLPELVDPSSLSAVPYAVGAGQSLTAVATLFGTDATTLGTDNQDVAGLFVAGQQVQPSGFAAVTTDGEDSIASLLGKFSSQAQPTLAQLIAAIAPSTTLLRPGALLVCPAPVVPSGGDPAITSLSALAKLFGADLHALARANAGVDGLLDPSATVTIGGVSETVGPHGTIAGVYARALRDGATVSFSEAVDALSGAALLSTGARFLLPPRPVEAGAALPASPAVGCTITPLATEVTIARPAAEVDPTLSDEPAIQSATAPVPPLASPAAEGAAASYVAFATGLESAYGNRLRVAVGARHGESESPGSQRLYAVRFEAENTPDVNAIEQVEVGSGASYYALPPLSNELVSRSAALRTYSSGNTADPLPAATKTRTFQAVDVEGWVADALAAIDLVLSPTYAPGAFTVTSTGGVSASFDALVDAKRVLAQKIAAGATAVLQDSAGDAASAAAALEQRLDLSLVDGFATDAVVQLPTTVQATFDDTTPAPAACADGGGHRLAGKTQATGAALSTATTLAGLAQTYSVHVAAIARLLGTTPNLLATGTVLTSDQRGWTIGATDTLADGVERLGLASLDAFAASFGSQAPLFRDGTTVTIDGFETDTAADDTLLAVGDRLDSPVSEVAVANQSVEGLLAVPGPVYVDGVAHAVTAATSSLAAFAAALPQPLEVEALGEAIAGQAALAASKTLRAVRWIPSHSLSPGRVDLDSSTGQVDLLLGVEQRAQYRRLLLNLDFRLTGLEYAIEAPPAVFGYERSEWLQFVRPLDEDNPTAATIATGVGQLDVPIPLRAYPTPPRLVTQLAEPTYSDEEVAAGASLPERLQRTKAWTYRVVVDIEEAAQDVVYLDVGFNFGPPLESLALEVLDDPFDALAEFVVNYPAIREDLANLLLPPAQLAADQAKQDAAASAVGALATIAGDLAAHWGPVRPGKAAAAGGGGPVPAKSYGFRLDSRTRSGPDGTNLMDSLVLTSTEDQATWGPDGVPPALGYLDADGSLVELQRVTDSTSEKVVYEFTGNVPAFARRSYSLWYADLDAVAIQNARTSAWLTRNEALVPGATTDPSFVYRTPEVHFHDPIAPSILRGESLSIGSGQTSGLAAAVGGVFTGLLGTPPADAATQEKLALRYGYRVAAAGGATRAPVSDDDLVVLTPVLFRPLFQYDEGVPKEIQAALDDWLVAAAPPAVPTALLSLDVTVFSDPEAGTPRPLVELKRLDYVLDALPG
jgi:hypothetical protein